MVLNRLLGLALMISGIYYFLYKYRYYKNHKDTPGLGYDKVRDYGGSLLIILLGFYLLIGCHVDWDN